MAQSLATPCRYRRCPAIVTDGTGYCDEHETAHSQQRAQQDDRPSARQRGYTTGWDRASRAYRAKNPLCERCKARGETTEADVVHHRTPLKQGGAKYDEQNLESLCRSCHHREHG